MAGFLTRTGGSRAYNVFLLSSLGRVDPCVGWCIGGALVYELGQSSGTAVPGMNEYGWYNCSTWYE